MGYDFDSFLQGVLLFTKHKSIIIGLLYMHYKEFYYQIKDKGIILNDK